jgi:hypothetical protein
MGGLLALIVLLLCCGCVHVDITVGVHDEDGGATITERLRLTQELQELCAGTDGLELLKGQLGKETALARAEKMGKGTVLNSHRMYGLPDGGVESLAVYEIPDVEDLRLTSPFLHDAEDAPASTYQLAFSPHTNEENWRYGQVSMSVKRVTRVPKGPGAARRASTPAERQAYRELQPVVADLLRNLEVALRVQMPEPFSGGYVRNIRAGPKTATLFSLSGRDLDTTGRGFLDNEEIMISLLELDLNADVIHRHACAFSDNPKTPVLRGKELYHPERFHVLPTKHMVNKYFGGRYPTR